MKMKALMLLGIALLVKSAESSEGRIEERIYNGYPASSRQFPYVALISNTASNGKVYGCTGSIFSPRWVLAAGHCVTDIVKARVYLGSVSRIIFNTSDPILIYTVPKENLYSHPDYNSKTLQNDLSLYKLPVSAPVNQYPNIKTIALPKKSDIPVTVFDNRNGTAVGWGAYNDTTPSPNSLMYAPVHIMNHSDCKAQLEAIMVKTVKITDGMICTDKTVFKNGICPGDSGGPLVVERSDGAPMVMGAASFIIGNCSNKNPAVYTFVTKYLDWISTITGISIS